MLWIWKMDVNHLVSILLHISYQAPALLTLSYKLLLHISFH